MQKTEHPDLLQSANIHMDDKKESYKFFVYLWLMYAVVNMTKNCYNGALAGIVADGVLTKSQTGLITAMFYLVYTPLQVLGGMVVDRFSPERMIKIGLIGGAVANGVIYFNHNYSVMMTAWILNAIVQFSIYPGVYKIVSAQLAKTERKTMIFYLSFSATSGTLLSYLVAAIVPSWDSNFAVSAVSLVVLAGAMHMFEKHIEPYCIPNDVPEEKIKPVKGQTPAVRIFLRSGFFFIVVGNVIATLVNQSRTTLTPVMLVENYPGISPSAGNMLNALMIVSGIFGTIVAGRLFKNIKNELWGVTIAYACLIPFLWVCRFVGIVSLPVLVVCLCCVALFVSVGNLFLSYYIAGFAKYEISGTAAGIFNSGAAFSYMLSAYAMTRIDEVLGWNFMIGMWPVIIVVSIVLIIIAIIIKSKNKY